MSNIYNQFHTKLQSKKEQFQNRTDLITTKLRLFEQIADGINFNLTTVSQISNEPRWEKFHAWWTGFKRIKEQHLKDLKTYQTFSNIFLLDSMISSDLGILTVKFCSFNCEIKVTSAVHLINTLVSGEHTCSAFKSNPGSHSPISSVLLITEPSIQSWSDK